MRDRSVGASIFGAIVFLLMFLCGAAEATFAIFQVNGAAYTGFLDQYPSIGATWGWSTYKLTHAYGGNFATIQRASDSTSTNIGWDVNNKANVSTFNSFCSGTTCSVTTLYDQTGAGNNATCSNVVAFVGSDSRIQFAPGPGGNCTVPYSATFSTAKQELFAVAYAAYSDFRLAQAGLPNVVVAGTLAAGNSTITAMSSQAGISATNYLFSGGGATGILDSAGYLPTSAGNPQTYLGSFPTGSTASMSFYNGGASAPTGSQSNDTLTFTNAVIGGAWIGQGPASGGMSSAYWAIGLGPQGIDGCPCDPIVLRNAAASGTFSNTVGEGMRGALAVWDFDTYTAETWFNGTQINGAGSSANVTYSTNVGLKLFEDAAGGTPTQNSVFEAMILVDQTYASRGAAGSWLETQFGISTPPTSVTTSDGFVWQPYYAPNDAQFTSIYGTAVTSADVYGLAWQFTGGGYAWPSVSQPTNINNSTTMWRFIVEPGDSDMNITGAERSEIAAGSATWAPGQYLSEFIQLNFEQFPSESTASGNWCDIDQVVYNFPTSPPDAIGIDCRGGTLQFTTGNSSSGTTNCGSAQSITAGVNYAYELDAFWSTNHTTDTAVIYFGTSGGNLTQVCSVSGALFTNGSGVYMKQGIYRGDHLANPNTIALRTMNAQWSNTQNAFSSLRTGTNQPALPTHP